MHKSTRFYYTSSFLPNWIHKIASAIWCLLLPWVQIFGKGNCSVQKFMEVPSIWYDVIPITIEDILKIYHLAYKQFYFRCNAFVCFLRFSKDFIFEMQSTLSFSKKVMFHSYQIICTDCQTIMHFIVCGKFWEQLYFEKFYVEIQYCIRSFGNFCGFLIKLEFINTKISL